jgi:hypothetical protein
VAKIPQWRAAFEALGELPRTEERALRDRLERALNRCQTQLTQARARDKDLSFSNLLQATKHVQHYGWAVATGVAAADCGSLKHAAEEFIAAVPQWPKGGAQAVKQALSQADSPAAPTDAAANETALRMLCIRQEMATGKQTPPSDHALRRDYQMRRLVEGMGQPKNASMEEFEALAMEWIRIGSIEPTTYEALLVRFLQGRAAAD